jgi:hypothetical protein
MSRNDDLENHMVLPTAAPDDDPGPEPETDDEPTLTVAEQLDAAIEQLLFRENQLRKLRMAVDNLRKVVQQQGSRG